jgi:hypothetical protein
MEYLTHFQPGATFVAALRNGIQSQSYSGTAKPTLHNHSFFFDIGEKRMAGCATFPMCPLGLTIGTSSTKEGNTF